MLYRTILAATDGFEHSDRAVAHAAHIAHETGAALHVVSITEPRRTAELRGGEYLHLTPQERKARVRDQLARISTALEIRSCLHILRGEGSVARQLAGAAQELGADVIIVGGHGRAPLPAALLGSVAQRLPSLTRLPIVVVPGGPPRTPIIRRLRGPHPQAAQIGLRPGQDR